jgi:hypothetical protein
MTSRRKPRTDSCCRSLLALPLALREMLHPNVAVSLVVESTRHALDALEAGTVDVARSTEQREEPQ